MLWTILFSHWEMSHLSVLCFQPIFYSAINCTYAVLPQKNKTSTNCAYWRFQLCITFVVAMSVSKDLHAGFHRPQLEALVTARWREWLSCAFHLQVEFLLSLKVKIHNNQINFLLISENEFFFFHEIKSDERWMLCHMVQI